MRAEEGIKGEDLQVYSHCAGEGCFIMSNLPALRRLAVTKFVSGHQAEGTGKTESRKWLMVSGYKAGVTAGAAEGGSSDMEKNESGGAQK